MTRRLEKEDDSRQGFPHYMLKEIHEQPRVLEITLASLLQGTSALDMLGIDRRYAQSIQRIELAACGTSWHAALIARRAIEELVGIPTTADIASEYRDWPRRQREGTLTIVISQSGETTDTLEAMRSAKRAGFRTGAIVNVPGSTMAREADGTIVTQAGTEVAIASTKAFTCQVAALLSIALGLGRMRGAMDAARERAVVQALERVPRQVETILRDVGSLARDVAREQIKPENFFYLGRGYGYPVAREGALKLKETSYVHAEAYPSGEFRHGPIALISEGVPVVAVAARSRQHDKILANLDEIREKGGTVIAVGTQGDADLERRAHRVLPIPETDEVAMPILAVVPLQLFAYEVAVSRGREVDSPRHLSKAVLGN
ncbi:MAG: isomerizing glutamine--fructose-6-phosphate transaminase [Pseudomonadota bacterium]|nr:MAG: hypothetical protein DIU72_06335 [Pseudomonadota bacterium]